MSDQTGQSTLCLELTPERDLMSIKVEGSGTLVRSAPQLEEVIKGMIQLREMMSPAIPMVNPTKETPVVTSDRMRWSAQSIPSRPGAVHLLVLHPGLGWVGITISAEGAQELAATILRCAQPAGAGRPN
ncbi:MAG: hypothetical protein ACRYG8_03570 [Janthinobacterium lividum]